MLGLWSKITSMGGGGGGYKQTHEMDHSSIHYKLLCIISSANWCFLPAENEFAVILTFYLHQNEKPQTLTQAENRDITTL